MHEQMKLNLSDRYAIEREIGSGGMATVYLARDSKHNRNVAIKVLRPELAAVLGARRFLAEIEVTADLQHPHILPLFDSGEANGLPYYVMPYIEGETLRQRLQRERQLPIGEAIRIATVVAGALDYAHRRGVIHRDLKPENILLHEGNALVADFGIALAVSKVGGTRLTDTGLSMGTPQYMSPEQAAGDVSIDARSDIHALGVVLYEMLVGEPPYLGNSAQSVLARILSATPAAPRTLRQTVPQHVDASVMRAIARLPVDRFATAAEFAESLTVIPPPTQGAKAEQPGSASFLVRPFSKWIAAALVVSAVLIAIVQGWLPLGRWSSRRSAPTPSTRQITFTGKAELVDISRDGQFLAYTAGEEPNQKLLVQDLTAAGTPRELASLTNITDLRWSPDGSRVLVSGNRADGRVL